MPGFELELVDGGRAVDLPHGETVLGRGSFLGVNDKRVSRNHCVLQNLNGHLRLKPTHVNPCFIQASVVATPQPLERDTWHVLQEGDIFSLMPGKYIYRVHVTQEDRTPSNSQGFEEQMEVDQHLSEPAELYEESATLQGEIHTPVTQSFRPTGNEKQAGSSHTLGSRDENEASLPERKRILPDWMLACASATKSPAAAKGDSRTVRGTQKKPKRAAGTKVTAEPKRARAAEVSSEEEEMMPKRKVKRLKMDSEDELDDVTAVKTTRVGSVPDRPSEEPDRRDVRGHSRTQAGGSSDLQVHQGPSQNTQQRSKVKQSESKTSSRKGNKQRRAACPYGSSCYRKNPVHFQECSHPGDSDYEEEAEDDDYNERPECPYGTHCYRKNPQHKKEYKHTKSPPKSPADDEDEDHYDDSFINDESEDEEVDEDSDYMPESDNSGKEDVKRLQKEARVFLRRKK